jgi:thiol:disulfide interchange protein
MEYVKSFFGVALLVMALWFLAPLSPALRRFMTGPEWGMYVGLGLATVGLFAGAIHLSYHGEWGERVRKTLAVLLTVVGAQIAINNALYVPTGAWRQVETSPTSSRRSAPPRTARSRCSSTSAPPGARPASRWRSSPSTTPRSSPCSSASSS